MDLFQSAGYLSFLEATRLFETFGISISRGNRVVGRMQGYIQKDGGPLKGFLSRRAIVNGGPLLADDITSDELKRLLIDCTKEIGRKAIYIETRNFKDYSPYREVFEESGFHYEPHYDFIIDTTSPEVVEAKMGKSRKRDVKVSLKNGATVIDSPKKEDVVSFYAILKDLYAKKVKTPLFPLDFFLKLWEQPFSKFILVKFGDEIVGGTVCVFDEDTVYEWFACGKDGVYKNVFPSTVATYYGIQFAAEGAFKRFDMMGAGAPGDGGYGVRDFKSKFGGELVEYGRFRFVSNPLLYTIGKWGVKLMKKL